jgi:bifunctional DNA-binding transcriptional regulator/antitoxin component of YhaV-PrlF toxin-antitoxin module
MSILEKINEILGVTKVVDNGRKAIIPKRVREVLDVEDGDEIVWFVVGNFIAIKKQRRRVRGNER